MRRLTLAIGFVLALAGSAAADVRIDEPRPAPARPQDAPPQVEDKGCASKSTMAPEWVFAAGALALGAWGLRRQRRTA